jgi:hypothetical protein
MRKVGGCQKRSGLKPFAGDALFEENDVRGVAVFDNVQFSGPSRFDRSVILGNTSLACADFRAAASLRNMQCNGGLWHGTEILGRT